MASTTVTPRELFEAIIDYWAQRASYVNDDDLGLRETRQFLSIDEVVRSGLEQQNSEIILMKELHIDLAWIIIERRHQVL